MTLNISELISRLRTEKLMVETIDAEARRYEYQETDLGQKMLSALETANRQIEELEAEVERRDAVLRLALEYWAHRQQRYKNRHPVWVQQARATLQPKEQEAGE